MKIIRIHFLSCDLNGDFGIINVKWPLSFCRQLIYLTMIVDMFSWEYISLFQLMDGYFNAGGTRFEL